MNNCTKLVLVVFMLISTNCLAQEIKWMSIEEAYAKTQVHPKKIVIDVYTAWCGWCKVMDKNTFRNEAVANYINENYYAVKLDAENQKDIKIGNNIYKFNPNNRVNEAAVTLLGGKMSYPSIVYLDEKFNMIQAVPGYMDAKAFHEVITFFGTNGYKKENFDAFKSGTYAHQFKGLKL